MITEADLQEITLSQSICSATSAHVLGGIPIPKTTRVQTFSAHDWEQFVEEWASSLKSSYAKVRRFGGSGDLGIDIAGFYTENGFNEGWDNYQCKHYDHPLYPGDIWIEIGKIIYYSYIGEYIPPSKHYFVCPKGIGTSLERLLNKPDELKEKTAEYWIKYCQSSITTTKEIELSGELAAYFDNFDFTIFASKSVVELIEDHSKTCYHAVRFGGGLPSRPIPEMPPEAPSLKESRYIRQLLDAYGDHLGLKLQGKDDLESHEHLKKDYHRQRERFYHAESLRNFARDTVPEGTFDALQDEVYHGVVDICEECHTNGYERMRATVRQATQVALTANPLSTAIKTQDRQGICHQLANDDRLTWVPDNE